MLREKINTTEHARKWLGNHHHAHALQLSTKKRMANNFIMFSAESELSFFMPELPLHS